MAAAGMQESKMLHEVLDKLRIITEDTERISNIFDSDCRQGSEKQLITQETQTLNNDDFIIHAMTAVEDWYNARSNEEKLWLNEQFDASLHLSHVLDNMLATREPISIASCTNIQHITETDHDREHEHTCSDNVQESPSILPEHAFTSGK